MKTTNEVRVDAANQTFVDCERHFFRISVHDCVAFDRVSMQRERNNKVRVIINSSDDLLKLDSGQEIVLEADKLSTIKDTLKELSDWLQNFEQAWGPAKLEED